MNQEDKQRNYELAEKLLSEQNFVAALIVGAIATLLAAAFYGIATSQWDYSYGFAAAAIVGQLISNVSFVDVFFWFVAVWFAVFLVDRPLSRSEKLVVGMHKLKS